MSQFFEELMDQNRQLTEGVTSRRAPAKKTSVTESKKIPVKKLKVESLKILEDAENFDEIDAQFAVDPEESGEDEVVLVIDPELPSDEEAPEDAAQDMIGDSVYKCSVCGSNYVCDCNAEKNESIEVDENGEPVECPICGDDAEQILIGEIAPAEDAPGEEVTETDPVDAGEVEDEEEIVDDDIIGESLTEDVDVIDTDDIIDEVPACEGEECDLVLDTDEADKKETDIPAVVANAEVVNVDLSLDEVRLESMMNQMIKENYKRNPSFKVTKLTAQGPRLKIEYVIREGKKSSKGTMIAEGFSFEARKLSLKAKDKGAFTESFTKKPAFIIECVRIRNKIIPTAVKYDFTKRVNESLYRVKGDVNSANFTKATRR